MTRRTTLRPAFMTPPEPELITQIRDRVTEELYRVGVVNAPILVERALRKIMK